VARHVYVSYVRSRILEDTGMASVIALWPPAVECTSPFEATAVSELERRIERALASMPRASREVLLLVGVAGLDHADAAEICGISAEAFRQRLCRARGALTRALGNEPQSASVLEEVPS
jgi:RNA polymerase sigma factor (sigma-70 family)